MPDVEGENQTTITEFILLGFGDLHELKIPVFMVFLAIYIVTLTGNILIIVTVSYKPQPAQTPAYDRYLAICKPLHYASTMSFQLCFQLAVGSWVIGFLSLVVTMPMVSRLPFCASKEIDHFFCDLTPIIKLSCGDTYMVRIPAFIIASLVSFLPFLLTLLSYYKIISTILKIPSTSGKQKAFSTCSSHLIVVSVFYGTLMVVYVAPIANQWPNLNKTFSVLYTVVTPLINPIVYSLRNTEVKETLRKLFSKNPC
ncbi:olfactory receptor 476-like [Gopherus flavomarginatus]|uniref:olfactory receptor 476-like n=1 Tax=Gopherus flavomarginatus TaxID=286002 RepID=UPI0021CBEEC4|nr:olfactory receptor 476-like [Gopherus flavomarginatus]